jgi:peptide/nickel transport system substrate-binding protein/oligopeptide transport system substrate-binding protein
MLLAGATLLLAAGFGRPAGTASAGPEAQKGGTLRLGLPADVDFVDPALAYRPRSWPFGFATCAKLFNYPDAQGAAGTRLVPEVVDRFTVSEDRRTYTFELMKTFRFHTGARVTAQSFADAFNRDAQPRLASPATAYMREIVGADAVLDGKATSISGIRVLGRYRLQIRLTRPLGDFTARLTLPFFCPVLPNTPIAETNTPAGSGPYYVAERIVNQRIVFERNPFYRGDRPANVDQVVYTISESQEACRLAVEQDRIDQCKFGLPETSYRALAERYGINRPGGQFFVGPLLSTWFVAFNHDRPAFRGPGQIPLAKAINYAIDRPELARAFGYLAGKRTDQLLPPALARPASIYPLEGADPATARKWLARARWRPDTLVLYATNDAFSVQQSRVLALNLKQIGIDLEVKYFDTNVVGAKIAAPGEPFDLALTGWNADYADPAAFFVPILARGSGMGVNLDDPRVNARIEAANRLTGVARRTAWADLDVNLMRDNPPWAPILHLQGRTFVSQSLGCFLDHPVYGFDFAAVCKKQ